MANNRGPRSYLGQPNASHGFESYRPSPDIKALGTNAFLVAI